MISLLVHDLKSFCRYFCVKAPGLNDRKWHCIGLVFILCLFVPSCRDLSPHLPTAFNGNAMTIDYRILIGKAISQKERENIQSIIDSTFEEVDKHLNRWNPTSELSNLNNAKGGEAFPLSPILEDLLSIASKIVVMTDGKFDPTIEPLQQLWKSSLQQGVIPSSEQIENLRSSIGWDKIQVVKGYVYKKNDRVSLDLGGIAKGYAVDLLTKRLHEQGFSDLFIEWGGEIRTTGMHPEKRTWNIAISGLVPQATSDHSLAIVNMNENAIATSGDYLQFWEIGGEYYSHVFDPRTLRPLLITETSIASVSVMAETCAIADGLATSAMLFPTTAEAEAWAQKIRMELPNVQFWIYSRETLVSKRPNEKS